MYTNELTNGESQNIEYKLELPVNSLKYLKTLVAYANTAGGKLIIGVEDETHEIVGVAEDKISQVIDNITNAIADNIAPQLVSNITTISADEKFLICVEIFPGSERPYYITSLGIEKGTYIRVNATTRPADMVILKDLQLQGSKNSYDEIVIPGKILDISAAEKFCETIQYMRELNAKNYGENLIKQEITLSTLENWKIIKRVGNTLYSTIAFDLLTENSQSFAKIQCGLFKGNDRTTFLDKREFGGPIYEQIEEAYKFVLKHINLGAEINGLYRNEAYELPPEAIREAIANAVTHRNYMENACTQVFIFDNRVEITSPGMLYSGLTMEMIKNGRTRIRNTAIALVFGKMFIIEGWGTGIKRMIRLCSEYNLPAPVFSEIGTDFRVEFYRKNFDFSSVCVDESLQKKYPELQLIMDNPSITINEMAKVLSFNKATVYRHIKYLKESKILSRVGTDKEGFWKVINNSQNS